MTIATFTELSTEIGEWLDRDDLTPRIPTFIRLVESRLNRLLEDPEMEVSASLTSSGGSITLPDDYGEMVSIGTPYQRLTQATPADFASFNNVSAPPRWYSITEGEIQFAPNAAASITLIYRRRIPGLTSTNPTNWLLTLAPDAYLYGALMQASAFLVEDSRAANWKTLFEEAIAELRADAQKRRWGSGPIAPRTRRT